MKAAPNLKTVGLILGPYRNLTTLTAAVLSLHPNTQVLNHAGTRLLTGRRNFVEHADEAHLDRFVDTALGASTEGRTAPSADPSSSRTPSTVRIFGRAISAATATGQ